MTWKIALMALTVPFFINCGTATDAADHSPDDVPKMTGTTGPLLLVGNKGEDTVSFIDLETGAELDRVATSATAPHEIAASPDGTQAAVVNYGDAAIDIFDLKTRKIVQTIDLGSDENPHGIVWLEDDRIIATTEGGRSIVEIAPDRSVTSIRTNAGGTHMLAVGPESRYAYTANLSDGSISKLDLQTDSLIKTVSAGAGTEGIDLTPDGTELWVSNRSANTVIVYDADTLDPLNEFAVGRFPLRLLISPDGRHAVTSNLMDGSLSVIDVASRELVRTIPVGGSPVSAQVTILFSDDGQTIYVAETGTDTIAEVDFESGTVRRRLPAGRQGDGLAVIASPN